MPHSSEQVALCLSGTWERKRQTFTITSSGTLSKSYPS